jgi:replicative DNA helicase
MLSDLRESGCLAAHTKIYDPISGEYNEIIDLVGKENFYVSALNPETLKLESVKAKKCFHSGRKKTYRLKTASGNEVEASANHPFLRGHDWIALEDLAVGDYIACNRVVTTPEKKCRVDDQELIVLPNPEDINKLANSDLFWDKIISIEPLDEVDVYDIEVPEFHNFLAENIIVHNSIEQDADMVMMIYRDDYYNPESEKAGMADLIIAKHRSGPVGIVELLFQASITKFKNPVRL